MSRLRHCVLGVSILSLAAAGGVACSSEITVSGTGDDAGTGTHPGTDGSSTIDDDSGVIGPAEDTGVIGRDGSTLPPGPDGGPPPTAQQLKTGDVTIQGVTSDDYVVYSVTAGATTSLEVVSLGGGTPTVLAATFDPQNDYALTDGKVVAFWTAVDAQSGIGALNVWTLAGGTKTNVAAASAAGFFFASEDGTRVAYSTNAAAATTDMAVATTANLPTASTVVTNIGGGCGPRIGFVGTRLFSATCAGAATTATVRTVGPAATTATSLYTNAASFWSTDSAATKIFVRSAAAGSASVRSATAGTLITSVETGVATGFMAADGNSVVYRTNAMALRKAATASPANPADLVAAPTARGLAGVSDDDKWVMLFSNAPDGANQDVTRIDMQLASATTAGTPTTLLATSTGSPVGFTGNSAFAVYMTDIGASSPLGTLRARGVAAGSTEKTIVQNVFSAEVVPGATAAKVAWVLPQQAGDAGLTFDVQMADLAGTAAPQTLATDIDGFNLTPTKVVYTQASKGLFVAAIP